MFVIFALLPLVVIIATLADIITRDEWQVKHLPKVFWIILVILIPLVGSILWFTIGREYAHPVSLGSFGDPRRSEVQRPTARPATTTEEELAAIDAEIEYHENQARIRRLNAEIEAKRRDGRA